MQYLLNRDPLYNSLYQHFYSKWYTYEQLAVTYSKVVKNKKLHICQFMLCFDLEVKPKNEHTSKHVFKKSTILYYDKRLRQASIWGCACPGHRVAAYQQSDIKALAYSYSSRNMFSHITEACKSLNILASSVK
jgi:hypothetical protein